jgi:signal transduction histidine kinase
MIPQMTRAKRKPSLIAVLAAVLLILLPAFAYLQYEWLGKVSEGEREQMQKNLERAARQLGETFDREIGAIYTNFQFEEPAASGNARADSAALYKHWLRTTQHPRLVSEILIAGAGKDGPSLERLNRESEQFETVDWPPELTAFRGNLNLEGRRTGSSLEVFVRSIPGPINAQIPAIFIPLIHRSPLWNGPRGGLRGGEVRAEFSFEAAIGEGGRIGIVQPATYLIVKLDLDYIRNEMLPSLVRNHFSPDRESDYDIAVVEKADPSKVILGGTQSSSGAGDVTADFFSLRFPDSKNLRPAAIVATGDVVTRASAIVSRGYQVRMVQGNSEHSETAGTFFASSAGAWKLIATHRAGSLDAAVSQVRRRNLAISGGILLLLGGSVAMILISSQRAQRLARQQMQFVSAVSHELRTPLAVICSAGENLADGVVDDPERMRQYGTVVRNEGRRLSEMVEQVLDYASLEAGRKIFNLRPIEISGAVQSALEACDLQIRETGFAIETSDDSAGASIMADKSALSRAIQNLISNALKYSGSSRWIGVRVSSADGQVCIAVEDKGVGIPSPYLPHIFESFYRGRAAIDAQIKGSGLGLCMVKQIVEAHGGSVAVMSSVGSGTTFRIVLPAIS